MGNIYFVNLIVIVNITMIFLENKREKKNLLNYFLNLKSGNYLITLSNISKILKKWMHLGFFYVRQVKLDEISKKATDSVKVKNER